MEDRLVQEKYSSCLFENKIAFLCTNMLLAVGFGHMQNVDLKKKEKRQCKRSMPFSSSFCLPFHGNIVQNMIVVFF